MAQSQQQSSAMIGGDGDHSYARNSTLQRDTLIAAEAAIREALMESLNVQTLLDGGGPPRIAIADFGCSVGPNTFFAIETILHTVLDKHRSESHSQTSRLQFQVFFNDQTTNDFNTLFASLPDPAAYFVAGVPGSFHARLFPSSSIHIAYSASSLHWLSQVPEEVMDHRSPAWNPGRIHYIDAPPPVVKAFADHLDMDINSFLTARGEEIVVGGIIVILMPGVPNGVVAHEVGIALTFLGHILMDMVKEGLVSEHEVDTFNIPHMYPSVEQLTRIIERNGQFKIVRMEMRSARSKPNAPIDMESAVMHLRAFTETSLASHMGKQVVEQVFMRALERKSELSHMLHSAGIQIGSQIFVVLQHK